MRAANLSGYPLGTPQAAGYLDVSIGHLYNLLSRGAGPRHVKYGGQLRFCQNDLERWILSRYMVVDAGSR